MAFTNPLPPTVAGFVSQFLSWVKLSRLYMFLSEVQEKITTLEGGGGGGGSVASTDITDSTTVGRAVLTAANQGAARSAIGAGTASTLAFTTDTTLAGDSDSNLPTEKATRAYVAASVAASLVTRWPLGMYGTGADGDADLDGTNTVAWASKSGSTYTMTRNAYLGDLTIRAGVTLNKGFVLYGRGTLTVAVGGTISDNGNAASGTTPGAAFTATSRLPECTTGAGGNSRSATGNGLGASTVTSSVGAQGGAGGTASAQTGGAGGPVTGLDPQSNTIDSATFLHTMLVQNGIAWARVVGGSGGGGGAVNTTGGAAASGAGGGGAPVSMLVFRTIVNNGAITCNGGAGGNATSSGGAAGGGGGGGGGRLIIVTDAMWTGSGYIQAAGGAGGTGAGGGASGSSGASGTVDIRYATA